MLMSALHVWQSISVITRLLVVSCLLIGAAMAAGAERNGEISTPKPFQIPAQPLIEALQAYSQQSGVQVMFETASAAGYKSVAVQGEFMPAAALRLLLSDTALRIRYSRTTAITLAPASAPDPDAPPAMPLASADFTLDTLHVSGPGDNTNRNELGEFIGTVQADIQNALKRFGRNRSGDFRIGVRLWIVPSSRTVEKAELDGSTGDFNRDSRIAEVLRGLTLSQRAPASARSPIHFMVTIQTL